jgi:hypothetical protein
VASDLTSVSLRRVPGCDNRPLSSELRSRHVAGIDYKIKIGAAVLELLEIKLLFLRQTVSGLGGFLGSYVKASVPAQLLPP